MVIRLGRKNNKIPNNVKKYLEISCQELPIDDATNASSSLER